MHNLLFLFLHLEQKQKSLVEINILWRKNGGFNILSGQRKVGEAYLEQLLPSTSWTG